MLAALWPKLGTAWLTFTNLIFLPYFGGDPGRTSIATVFNHCFTWWETKTFLLSPAVD